MIVEGVPIRFEPLGRGRPVVLLHGASGNLRDWTMAAAPEIARRHMVIAFDRPGLGLSGWPGPDGVSLLRQAALLRGALAQLDVPRVILVGHSYGGAVALAWALDAPDTVAGLLVLSAPSQVWEGGRGLASGLLANPVTGPLLSRAAPALVPGAVVRRALAAIFAPQIPPPDYLERLGRELVLSPAVLRANALQLEALKSQIRAQVPGYPRLAMPLEIVHGTADRIVPLEIHAEALARQVPHARLTRLPGIGHMPHHTSLPEVLSALHRLTRGRPSRLPRTRPKCHRTEGTDR